MVGASLALALHAAGRLTCKRFARSYDRVIAECTDERGRPVP
jgi:hypothetical protein